MRHNGARSESEILALIAAWLLQPEKSRKELSGAELLARAACLDVSTFVRLHSTLPLRRSIATYLPNLIHGCPQNKDMLLRSGMRLARNEAYLCLECIAADHAEHGMCYWHRDHQLPGVIICDRHCVPLRYHRDPSCFRDSPSLRSDEAEEIDLKIVEDAASNSAITQYLAMTRKLASDHRPIPVELAVEAMKQKAIELSLQYRPNLTRDDFSLASDQVLDAYPSNWLESVFPEIGKKVRGTWMHQLDGTLHFKRGASSYVAYILICSLLFASADEAVAEMKGARRPVARKRIADASDLQMKLVDAYVEAKGVYKNIRLNQRTANGRARAFLNGVGLIDFSDVGARAKFVAAKAFLCDKKSLVESAQLGGIRVDVLEAVIRKMGSRVAMVWRRIE